MLLFIVRALTTATAIDCGELKGEDYDKATEVVVDPNGDVYEDYPEDEPSLKDAQSCYDVAVSVKEIGNKCIKTGQLKLAQTKYQKGLRYLADPKVDDASGDLGDKVAELSFVIHSNLSMIENRMLEYGHAIKSATEAIELANSTAKTITPIQKAKALFRRATAYADTKRHEEAIADLTEAYNLAPQDAGIKEKLNETKKAHTTLKAKQKAAYSKFFVDDSDSPSDPTAPAPKDSEA